MPQKTNTPLQTIPARSNLPHKSYKHIAIIFVVLAFILILGVTYLALSKVTITLIPANEPVTYDFTLIIADDVTTSTSTDIILPGKILSDQSEVEQQFSVEAGKEVDAQAEGLVTIYNDRNQAQSLVATTRLLSPENVLFRLKNKITIPANSSTRAKVYADQPGASGNIPPTKFTIPGLSESLQKLVYAESKSSMTGGVRLIGVLTQSDLEKAEAELIKTNSEQSLAKFIDSLNGQELTLIDMQTDLSELSYDEELGEEVDSFNLSGKLLVQAVFADEQALLNLAKNQLKESQGPKGEFVNADPSSLEYELVNIDLDKKEATLKVSISGLTTLDPEKDIFDKNLLVGFTEDDLKLYFSQFESIKDVQVEFSPFWVKKVPILKDHIYIQVAE